MTHPQTAALEALLELVEAGADETDYWWKDPALGALIEPLYMKGQPAFYGSIDAAKALHEAVLPGWDLSICTYEDDLFEVSVSKPVSVKTYDGLSEIIARAWLIAVLRTLIATTDTEGR